MDDLTRIAIDDMAHEFCEINCGQHRCPAPTTLEQREWKAWQRVVKELRKLKVEINDQDKLTELLNQWAATRADIQR